MNFVSVSWTGRCREAQTRLKLIANFRRLAEQSERYIAATTSRRREPVAIIDREIKGKIMVSSQVAPDARIFEDQARQAGLSLIGHSGIDGEALAEIENVHLRGVDFTLFDSASLDSNRLSFVFLETAQAPFLDGALVQIASSRLCRPKIELPSDLGDWIDLLFSWVKFFHVGDFAWQREELLQNYPEYRAILLGLQNDLGPERAEAAAFDALLATFANHAEDRLAGVSA